MIKLWQKRAGFILFSMILISCSIFIVFRVFNNNIIFFFSPTELEKNMKIATESNVRVGGLVTDDSIKKISSSTICFTITDLENELVIEYTGIIPALFKEGQSTIAYGKFIQKDNIFKATELLAKHDENYMPKEVADALKKSGKWKNQLQ